MIDHLHRGAWPRRVLAAAGALSLVACGTYVEPKPGVYRGPGLATDMTCIYEAPTNSLQASWRCRTNEAAAASAEAGRQMIDSIRPLQPRDP